MDQLAFRDFVNMAMTEGVKVLLTPQPEVQDELQTVSDYDAATVTQLFGSKAFADASVEMFMVANPTAPEKL